MKKYKVSSKSRYYWWLICVKLSAVSKFTFLFPFFLCKQSSKLDWRRAGDMKLGRIGSLKILRMELTGGSSRPVHHTPRPRTFK